MRPTDTRHDHGARDDDTADEHAPTGAHPNDHRIYPRQHRRLPLLSFYLGREKINQPQLDPSRRQEISPQQDTRHNQIIRLAARADGEAERIAADAQRLLAVDADAVDKDSLLGGGDGAGESLVLGAADGDIRRFDDAGHVLQQLFPGFFPLARVPVADVVAVGMDFMMVPLGWDVSMCLVFFVRAV